MKKEIMRNETLWYFQVPQKYIIFEQAEKSLFGDNTQQWAEIDFTRPSLVPKVWKAGQPVDALSSADFLQEFFWGMKKLGEKIEIKTIEEIKVFNNQKVIGIETREELIKIMDYITTYGIECGIVYSSGVGIERMIRFQPGEQMYIYLDEEDVSEMKQYLSKYGRETTYSAYHSDELG